jgi:hypothetical protein
VRQTLGHGVVCMKRPCPHTRAPREERPGPLDCTTFAIRVNFHHALHRIDFVAISADDLL